MNAISPKETTRYRGGETSPALRLMSLVFAVALVASSCADQPESSESVITAEEAARTGSEAEALEIPAGDESIVIMWQEAGISGESFFDDLMATETGYRVYRFAHGPMAWTSSDGVSWTPREVRIVTSSEQIGVYAVVAGGPGFLATGTDSATPEGPDDDSEMLWVSQDGFTWEKQEIVLEEPTLGVFAEAGPDELVSGPGGLLMVGRMDRGPGGPDEHGFVLWASQDGRVWDLIENPFPVGAYVQVEPTPHGFIAYGFVEGSDEPFELWSSVDGYSWVSVDTGFVQSRPPPSASAYPSEPQFAIWDDQLLVGITGEDGIRLWSSADTQTWEPLPTSQALDHTEQMLVRIVELAAGPAGVVIVGGIEQRVHQPERKPVEVEKDGRRLIVDPETELLKLSDTETGEVLLEVVGTTEWDQVTVQEEDSISYIDPGSGETLLSISLEEWFTAVEEAGWVTEPPRQDSFIPVLWFSPDGDRWTSFGVEETFGIDEMPENVVVGQHGVILHWSGWSLLEQSDEFEEEMDEDPPGVMWVGLVGDSG